MEGSSDYLYLIFPNRLTQVTSDQYIYHLNLVTPFAEMRRSQSIYPALHTPAGLNFANQFPFKPSGSTAALVALFDKVRKLYAHCMGMGGTVKREKGRRGY